MKKKIFVISFLVILIQTKAQDYVGFNQSNYAGVTGIYQQPASIVDNRLKFDMTLIGFNLAAYNNYVGIKRSALTNREGIEASDFKEKINSKDKSIYFSNRINGPSVMFNINHKNAIALSTSVRNYVNIDGVSPDLAKLAYEQFNYPSLWVTKLKNKNLSVQEMTWAEYGLTFAHIFKEDNEHYFKAGGTVKLLQGIQSAYVFIKDLEYKFTTDTTLSLFQSEVNYGHSDNFDFGSISFTGGGNNINFGFSQAYPGVALDLGAVYEWRPDYKNYKYNIDDEKDLWRKDKNKYKLKIGISITDIGSIKFRKGSTSGDFRADVGLWNLKPINPKTVRELDDTLINRFKGNQGDGQTYKMNLPTAFSMQIDYLIWKDFYINLTPFLAMQFKNNDTKVHDISSITLTPRWDHKWFGAFVPVQVNALDGFRTGLALRLGPLVIGTSNLAPLLGKQNIFGADAYALLKIPIFYKKPKGDKDKDGISDKNDVCVDIPGVYEFMGCPDKDGDHVKDSEDKCPDIAGSKEAQGCPDKDNDGIADSEDKCPDKAGSKERQGCPDKDGDNIIDNEDECPDDAGLIEFLGCPDRDGDKTPDKYDLCPDIPGSKENKGCPDKDGDTVLDKDDDCPDVAGAIENKGCPLKDTDNDGVPDKLDDCPTTPGLKELKGCPPAPVLKIEEQKILEKAFSSLEFASGKDIIKPISLPSLNELSILMKEHQDDWVLKLSGHTDNKGDAVKNTLLSEKRAKAVKKYLVSKGIKTDKVLVEWFGPNKPIAENETEAGRQKNRRVEMKVEFKK